MKLPLAKYSVDGAAAEGSRALLSRCADDDSPEDSESEDENEFANVVQESGGGESMVVSKVLGGGILNEIGGVGPIRAGGRQRTANVRLQDQG